MRMRAILEVTVEVEDFVEAGRHEQFLKEVRGALEERFGSVTYRFHECRTRGGHAVAPPPSSSRTGRLKHYDS
ncbi:MAG TPA: hypothetical protein VED40_18350 [Azospirillaceae bacterium]|nr:hypothetical protein [Azospirillaceae bacterium]